MADILKPIASLVVLALVWGISTATNNLNTNQRKNETQSYNLQMTRMLCIDTPYLETKLLECRTTLRRNQMPLLRVVIQVPNIYNHIMIQYNLYYKFKTYQPFLINGELEICYTLREIHRGVMPDLLTTYIWKVLKDLMPHVIVPCPHGNRTYVVDTVFKKEYAPRSVPAGDYRLDLRFATERNVTMLFVQGFLSVRRKGVFNSMIEW
ncbi:uncharacterized protein LOC128299589 [Anopheles moucheti]|uniref:uncharacterized protein LOC128299589 n=1 Tax=Anopheles moucheti TaxID=186751 RepID=UPI0022EFEA42|nr:uncharacterized protein LOC128299589 [Anopheles moucheti]